MRLRIVRHEACKIELQDEMLADRKLSPIPDYGDTRRGRAALGCEAHLTMYRCGITKIPIGRASLKSCIWIGIRTYALSIVSFARRNLG